MKIIKFSFGYILMVCLILLSANVYASDHHGIHIAPATIQIKATYNGQDVFVSGSIPKDAGVLVKVKGTSKTIQFKQKAKALKLLWMNMGTITVDNLPDMMLLYPSESIEKLIKEKNNSWKNLRLGFDDLKKNISIAPKTADKETLFKEIIKLKESENLFGLKTGRVQMEEKENFKKFRADIKFPSNIGNGEYDIQTYVIKDGAILYEDHQSIKSEKTGFPLFLSKMAFDHSLIYGILAVIIAIFAGIITGVIFNDSEGAH